MEDGGLGIQNLKVVNIALLKKWGWKVRIERDMLWYTTLTNKYSVSNGLINYYDINN